ncbi:MAG: flagellar biosynthesis protein FlgD [Acidovorax sp. SCN 65-28]|uniref:flagellar hook assembly protein FlgD n=1 Tax=Acidovorax sp. TaxID=1872122 RepID=UPI00086F9109|nr:flagellar hook capping FlgD N-terminal domain-containing protein [Acidovorax sp.]MBN9626621.1 flagellar hook assembly protein FlgD [Acidovorax sp.]ODS78991.1 MAG: flagellar biosynthesis protein FlgD [Acidovorax sp. SCN 65-28]OJT97321.1 MAG: flagellar biosynthesis protein FlgD [Acidovorax sp. 65-7]
MILSATNAVTTTTDASTKANAASDPSAAQDRFLKLLVAQLNNQDPMNPLDNAQMTSQIAQINTVTGIQQLNQTMQSMASQFNSLQVMQGTALVGRSVLTEGSSMAVAVADKTGKGGFELGSAATNVKIEVTTAGGQVVDTIDLGAKAAGRHTFDWDASKYTGSTDALQFRVTAVNGSTKLDSTPLSLSKVTAAGAEDGQLVLSLSNGKTINYSQIKALV